MLRNSVFWSVLTGWQQAPSVDWLRNFTAEKERNPPFELLTLLAITQLKSFRAFIYSPTSPRRTSRQDKSNKRKRVIRSLSWFVLKPAPADRWDWFPCWSTSKVTQNPHLAGSQAIYWRWVVGWLVTLRGFLLSSIMVELHVELQFQGPLFHDRCCAQ